MWDKKTPAEIAKLKAGGKILSEVLAEVASRVRPGITGFELNQLAEDLIKKAGGQPAFKNYRKYPFALCVSINQTVVHGLPNKEPFQEGDIVGLDLGLKYQGFYTDMAVTVPVGKISKAATQLLAVTQKSLEIGLSQLGPDKTLDEIGRAIEKYVKPFGYSMVRDLAGHGVGRAVHEDPLVPNYDTGHKMPKMFPGLVLAIEPMVLMGRDFRVYIDDDKWSVNSLDHSLAAHFEHTAVVTEDGYEILTK